MTDKKLNNNLAKKKKKPNNKTRYMESAIEYASNIPNWQVINTDTLRCNRSSANIKRQNTLQ